MARLCHDPTITAHRPSPGVSGGRTRSGHPHAGQLLAGRYRLRQPVTIDPAGAVWRAYDELLAREVAAKQLTDRHSRGLAEARIAARVRHPSVATVHDAIRQEESDWIVMDYHRGGTLADLLDCRHRLPPPVVAALGLQVVAALTAVHAAGVVHCDVKPENLLLGEDGRLILIDFGVAESADNIHPARGSGDIVGSPAYIAPELLRGEAPRPRPTSGRSPQPCTPPSRATLPSPDATRGPPSPRCFSRPRHPAASPTAWRLC